MPNVIKQDMWDTSSYEYFPEHAQKNTLKKIAIFVTLVQDKENEGSGSDIGKVATHSRAQTH